jgi:hypothetical protein
LASPRRSPANWQTFAALQLARDSLTAIHRYCKPEANAKQLLLPRFSRSSLAFPAATLAHLIPILYHLGARVCVRLKVAN